MEVSTKYNINDEVWFISKNTSKPISKKITGIYSDFKTRKETKAATDGTKGLVNTGNYVHLETVVAYKFIDNTGNEYWINENVCFATKEELIKSLS